MADAIAKEIQKAIVRHKELLATAMKTDTNITSVAASCQSDFM